MRHLHGKGAVLRYHGNLDAAGGRVGGQQRGRPTQGGRRPGGRGRPR
ncbi:hypothetical protein [Streptomyces sp. NPDC052036]